MKIDLFFNHKELHKGDRLNTILDFSYVFLPKNITYNLCKYRYIETHYLSYFLPLGRVNVKQVSLRMDVSRLSAFLYKCY